MPATAVRRFTLLDGMILIAATAAGIACSRGLWLVLVVEEVSMPTSTAAALELGVYVLLAILPLLPIWTAAIFFLRLRRPRPNLRRLSRQPGFVACLAVVSTLGLFLVIGNAIFLVNWGATGFGTFAPLELLGEVAEFLIICLPLIIQTGVFCAWVTLAVSRRWRSERSWIDRAGRLLGVAWLVLVPLSLIILVVHQDL